MSHQNNFKLIAQLCFVAVFTSGCIGGFGYLPVAQSVRGQIIELSAESLHTIEVLAVEDGNGRIWRFDRQDRPSPGFTPSHLREHMILGNPITITFHEHGGVLVIDVLKD